MTGSAIFVHDPGDYSLSDPGDVVALTATAIEACRRDGIAAKVLDDLTPRPEVCRHPDAYQRWQLDWLRRLDDASHLNGVAKACAHLIIPAVDAVVITSRMLVGAVDALVPDSITYVGKTGPVEPTGYHNGHLQFWPALGDVPLAARLLALIAEARTLTYVTHEVDRQAASTSHARLSVSRVRRDISRSIGPYRRLYLRRLAGRSQRPSTLMLWYAGYGAEEFAADERAAGRDTSFITRGKGTFRLVDPRIPPRRPPSRQIDVVVPRVEELDPTVVTLLDEVDTWAGIPRAGRLLESRLAVYLQSICPDVATAARHVLRELSHFGVSRVAAANPSSLEEFACLVAARAARLPRVLIQHGDHLMPCASWLVTETVNFDELASSDPTLGEELTGDAHRLGVRAPRVTYYAPRIAALLNSKAPRGRGAHGPQVICYVPAFLLGDSKSVSGCNYDDAWYHRWHLRLLDLMTSRPDLRFMWKGLPSSDQAVDPIPGIIAHQGIANIEYESRPFVRVIRDVDRIFTDFPSTALYESVHLRKPVLALVFPRLFSIRPLAEARFAQVLRACDTDDDALRHIKAFLDSDPDLWVLPKGNLALP